MLIPAKYSLMTLRFSHACLYCIQQTLTHTEEWDLVTIAYPAGVKMP